MWQRCDVNAMAAYGSANVRNAFLLSVISVVGLPVFALAAESSLDSNSAEISADRFPTFIPKKLDELFSAGSFPNPGGSYKEVNYRLFKPVIDNDRRALYPLILYFHGHGHHEMSWRNVGQLKHLDQTVFRELDLPERYPFFFLAVQCPKDNDGKWLYWYSQLPTVEDGVPQLPPAELSLKLVDQLIDEYPIDPNRIYLFGISSGAGACWELASRHPDRFAAVVPTASGSGANLERLKDAPIWAFHSEADKPEAVEQTVESLKALGGRCHLTVTPASATIVGGLHNSWYSAFQDFGALEWMLEQRRGSMTARPPGTLSMAVRLRLLWQATWPRVVPITILAVFIYCGYRIVRRRLSTTDHQNLTDIYTRL